jgi:PAS domain S-box-containing protein
MEVEMSASEVQIAERVARVVTDVVGDGCAVLRVGANSGVEAVTVTHRDAERRAELSALVAGDHAPRPWLSHSLAKDLAFRLRHGDAAAAVSPAHGRMLDVSAAVVAPVRLARDMVVVAFRDSCDFGYSVDDQRRVDQLAGGASVAETLRAAETGGGKPTPARALELAPAAVWVTDSAGTTTFVNHAGCQLAGAAEPELVGRRLTEFVDTHAAQPYASVGTSQPRDQIFTRPDGGELWVSIQSAPLSDRDGISHGTIHTLTEVGERRALEVAARLRASAYEAVADFAEVALAGEDFSVLAQEAVSIAADALGADYAALAEVGPARSYCTLRAARGWPRNLVGERFPLPERSAANLCLDDDGPVVVRDYAACEHLERGTRAEKIAARSCVCVAVGERAGVLSAHSKMPGAFSEQDLSFLGLLTAVLASRWEAIEPASPPARSGVVAVQ